MSLPFILNTEVDGEWADWTQWSVCSVTCEAGKKVRSRTCSNPSPAHGGQDCIGNKTEVKGCQKQLCPGIVHNYIFFLQYLKVIYV
jgi:hypothetical protein